MSEKLIYMTEVIDELYKHFRSMLDAYEFRTMNSYDEDWLDGRLVHYNLIKTSSSEEMDRIRRIVEEEIDRYILD